MTSRTVARGRYIMTAYRDGSVLWQTIHPNFVTDEGLSYMARTALGGAQQQTSWYLGIKGGNNDAQYADTLAVKNWTEVNGGVVSTRPQWVPSLIQLSPATLSNRDVPAVINFIGDSEVSGVFLASGPTVGSQSDLLFSVADWLTTQEMRTGDRITIVYEMALAGADE